MKRKEINEYAQSIVVRLYDIGYFGSVQESVSTNSFYIHITQVPDIIRLSDHGFNYEMYNFLPRQKIVRSVKNGKYFYSMSYDGIEAFINDFKQHNHVIDEDIDLVKEKQLTALKYTKRYVLCHLPTNTYYYENSNGYGKGMREMLYQKYNVMGERLCNFLVWNFRFNVKSAAIFRGEPIKAEIEAIVKDYDSIDNYKLIEVEHINGVISIV